MSDQYLGEIRMFSGNYAPQGWAFCDGREMKISNNEALYSLIGTTYGGDGVSTFALPDLKGRIPIHQGEISTTKTNYSLGQKDGTEKVTLTLDQLANHSHGIQCASDGGTSNSPQDNVWAKSSVQQYSLANPDAKMKSSAVSAVGGNQAHENMMPYLTLTYIIALQGMYPDFN
ncbi:MULTISPECIES: phage tail protein [Lysinibacillus]|uniref:phage tail protein n=1 Tax=Lysinibacillus TaxID=400634 RepID=UPI00258E6235|nr:MULTISPECIES: tail fiber protein [Lysinibacillus]